MIELKVKAPICCRDCGMRIWINEMYICNAPIDNRLDILDIGCFKVDLESRPDWCPMAKVVEAAEKMSDENKILLNKAIDGLQALFELIDNSRGDKSDY